jgi:hypothetical protein
MIEDPFGQAVDGRVPLKIGQYVTARLTGKTLTDALVIPNNTIYQGTYVYVVEEGILQRRNIEIAWQNDDDAVVTAGLESGDALVTTPLGQVTSGIRVSVVGEQRTRPARQAGEQGGRPGGEGGERRERRPKEGAQ